MFFFPSSLTKIISILSFVAEVANWTKNVIALHVKFECKDNDERFCPSYVRIYGDRFCDQDWFISDSGRYGCKLSCKLCRAPCEDKNESFCPSYVRIYGKRFCDADWIINGERYGCKKSCELC